MKIGYRPSTVQWLHRSTPLLSAECASHDHRKVSLLLAPATAANCAAAATVIAMCTNTTTDNSAAYHYSSSHPPHLPQILQALSPLHPLRPPSVEGWRYCASICHNVAAADFARENHFINTKLAAHIINTKLASMKKHVRAHGDL